MRAWIPLALLSVAVAALGAWVYYRPVAAGAESGALSSLRADEVKRIRLERANEIVLERANADWRMTQPFSARADAFQVQRLLAILEARSSARLPATDLARYGLDAPQAKLTLDEQTFSYGAVNTMTREQYVLTNDTVHAVALAQRMALPRDANQLISRALFGPGETPVRFELPGLTVALDDGKWTTAPAAGDVSADERNAWVDAWREATAVQAARHGGGDQAGTQKITVGLKDGRTITLGILQREPELVLLRTDESVEYRFFADSAKRLLAPPQAKQ